MTRVAGPSFTQLLAEQYPASIGMRSTIGPIRIVCALTEGLSTWRCDLPIPQIHSHIFRASLPFAEALAGKKTISRALSKADISLRALEDPPLFIPLKVQAAVAEALARETGIPAFAAMATRDMPYSELGEYAKYVLSGHNLGNSIARGIKGYKYIYRNSKVYLHVDNSRAFLGFDLNLRNHVGASNLDEAFINALVKLIRHFAGDDWTPDCVKLRNHSNGSTGLLERIFSAEVHIGAKSSGISFPAETLNIDNPRYPAAHSSTTYRELRKLVGQLPDDSMSGSVKQIIDLQIRLGDASIERVAQRMNIGVRTLQRRLKAESESFQSCLDSFRVERAMALLSETQYSIPEIAASLGFMEPNSFRRAFRSWKGITAAKFRNANRSLR